MSALLALLLAHKLALELLNESLLTDQYQYIINSQAGQQEPTGLFHTYSASIQVVA